MSKAMDGILAAYEAFYVIGRDDSMYAAASAAKVECCYNAVGSFGCVGFIDGFFGDGIGKDRGGAESKSGIGPEDIS